jgi:hypothetical protein
MFRSRRGVISDLHKEKRVISDLQKEKGSNQGPPEVEGE